MPARTPDPQKVFDYVKEIKALAPQTSIERDVNNDRDYTFSTPLHTSKHTIDTTPRYLLFGQPGTAAAAVEGPSPADRHMNRVLPPLSAFDEPSVLRSIFERDHPRPTPAGPDRARTTRPSSTPLAEPQVRSDRITAATMASFLSSINCNAHDCVTPNDFAVRVAQALRVQYNINAKISTAPVTSNRPTGAGPPPTSFMIAAPASPTATKVQVAGSPTARFNYPTAALEAKLDDDQLEELEHLRREVRSQELDLQRLEAAHRRRIRRSDLRPLATHAAAMKECVEEMRREIGFIGSDIKEAFAEWSRDFELIPAVKEVLEQSKAKVPKAVQARRAAADAAAKATADQTVSSGAALRSAARIVEAVQFTCQAMSDLSDNSAGVGAVQQCNRILQAFVEQPADAGELLTDNTLKKLGEYEGSERPHVMRSLRACGWMLLAAEHLAALRADKRHLEDRVKKLAAALSEDGGLKRTGSRVGGAMSAVVAVAKGKPQQPPAPSKRPDSTRSSPANAKAHKKVLPPRRSLPDIVTTASIPQDPTRVASHQLNEQIGVADDIFDGSDSVRPPPIDAGIGDHADADLSFDGTAPHVGHLESPRRSSGAAVAPRPSAAAGYKPQRRLEVTRDAPKPVDHMGLSCDAGTSNANVVPMNASRSQGPVWARAEVAEGVLEYVAERPSLANVTVLQFVDWLRTDGHLSHHPTLSLDVPDDQSFTPLAAGARVPTSNASRAGTRNTSLTSHASPSQTTSASPTPTAKHAIPHKLHAIAASTPVAEARRPSKSSGQPVQTAVHEHVRTPIIPMASLNRNGTEGDGTGLADIAPLDRPGHAGPQSVPDARRLSQSQSQREQRRSSVSGQPSGRALQSISDDRMPSPILGDASALFSDSPAQFPGLARSPVPVTPSVAAATVLKFRMTPVHATAPQPSRARTLEPTGEAAVRLERMRRALEGGLQLHRYRQNAHLLFDETQEVPRYAEGADQSGLVKLGDSMPDRPAKPMQ
jgi:hypothetical protein